jgi:hypothetical protein
VLDVGGVVTTYHREPGGEERLYSVDPGTLFVVGWKDNLPRASTNNVEETEEKGNTGVVFCWDPGSSVTLEVQAWVGEQHLKTMVPEGLTADDFRRHAQYDPEAGAWYVVLDAGQTWAEHCTFDPVSPCIFVTSTEPVGAH